MKRLPLRLVMLLVGAAVYGPLLTAAAAEPPSDGQAAGSGQKPCELERDVKVHDEVSAPPAQGLRPDRNRDLCCCSCTVPGSEETTSIW